MKTISKLANSNKWSIPVLNTVNVTDDYIMATDMDMIIYKKNIDTPIGLYECKPFGEGILKQSDDSVDSFPIMPMIEPELTASMSYDDLKYCSLAMSKEATRYYLNGICIDKNNMIATDGHRLHLRHLKAALDSDNKPIIPKDAIKYILAIAKSEKVKELTFIFTDTRMQVFINDYVIVSKLVNGTFPEYERIIPKNNDKSMTYDFKELKKLKSKVKALDNKLHANLDNGYITVNDTRLEAPNLKLDTPITINFKYLLDIGNFNSIDMNDYLSPIIFNQDNGLSVLMPMKRK